MYYESKYQYILLLVSVIEQRLISCRYCRRRRRGRRRCHCCFCFFYRLPFLSTIATFKWRQGYLHRQYKKYTASHSPYSHLSFLSAR